jgi:hypothetical protein
MTWAETVQRRNRLIAVAAELESAEERIREAVVAWEKTVELAEDPDFGLPCCAQSPCHDLHDEMIAVCRRLRLSRRVVEHRVEALRREAQNVPQREEIHA